MMLDGTDLPPLHSASRDGDLGAVRSLLKRTDASARDAWGETPLHWASTAKVAECLVAAGASVNVQDPTGDTPLHWAVENANAAVAGLLLESNAEVNAANRRGDTPLHAAASSGDWGILRLVLDKGGDAKKVNLAGESAMHVACRSGDVNLAKALVKAGARVKAATNDGTTALHDASSHGSVALAKYLLQRGADHNALTKAGRSALQNAVKRKNVALVDELIEKGSDVTCLTQDATQRGHGWSVMHLGAEIGSLKLLQAIVKKGAQFYDPEAKNAAGQTPSDVARASALTSSDKVMGITLVTYMRSFVSVRACVRLRACLCARKSENTHVHNKRTGDQVFGRANQAQETRSERRRQGGCARQARNRQDGRQSRPQQRLIQAHERHLLPCHQPAGVSGTVARAVRGEQQGGKRCSQPGRVRRPLQGTERHDQRGAVTVGVGCHVSSPVSRCVGCRVRSPEPGPVGGGKCRGFPRWLPCHLPQDHAAGVTPSAYATGLAPCACWRVSVCGGVCDAVSAAGLGRKVLGYCGR